MGKAIKKEVKKQIQKKKLIKKKTQKMEMEIEAEVPKVSRIRAPKKVVSGPKPTENVL
jgi:hypothetical protein